MDWGREIPEYDVVDWVKLRYAVTDPYGYRTRLQGVSKVGWSEVKTLYR